MKYNHEPSLISSRKPFTGLLITLCVSIAALTLVSCGQNDSSLSESSAMNSENKIKQHAEYFSGCYKVSKMAPAQIKISLNNDQIVMQMKEAKSENRVWDDPETMEVMSLSEVSKFFPVDSKHINAMIGRSDRKMVLASIKEAYANTNPMYDSDFLVYILRDSNTIYKVECDNVPIDFEHNKSTSIDSNIVIKPAGKVETTQE